jgi:heme/copper-type cytochrome/quinol oxidase subunit 2
MGHCNFLHTLHVIVISCVSFFAVKTIGEREQVWKMRVVTCLCLKSLLVLVLVLVLVMVMVEAVAANKGQGTGAG